MLALLIFVGVLVAIAVGAIIVNRVKGVRAHYLDSWSPAQSERRVLDDPAADFYVVPAMGQAKIMSFARRHRTHAVLTDARLVIATRALMSKRYMITYIVQLADDSEAQGELDRLTGGQFTKRLHHVRGPGRSDDGGGRRPEGLRSHRSRANGERLERRPLPPVHGQGRRVHGARSARPPP